MRILIVEDDRLLRIQLKNELERTSTPDSKHQIVTASNLKEAQDLLQAQAFDIAFVDLNLAPNGDRGGIELLKQIQEKYPNTVTIVMTGTEDSKVVEQCLLLGAADYIFKPYEPRIVHHLMIKARVHHQLFRNYQALRAQIGSNGTIKLKTKSAAFQDVLDKAEQLRGTNLRVLITGESGTGKEVLARYIASAKKNHELVTVHTGALQEHLVESTLFGHVKGAFTGAVEDKAGVFETADGGDIFLDEIGTTPHDVQVKLLRTLNSGEVVRVGATKGRKFEFRVIAATNEDLKAMVKKKLFREDLYYRLSEVELKLPPLRERVEDIPDLIKDMLAHYGKSEKSFSKDALNFAVKYPWPGNIRQLDKVVKVLAAFSKTDKITREELENQLQLNHVENMATRPKGSTVPTMYSLPNEQVPGRFQVNLEELEQAMVRFAMGQTENDTQAAKFLGIPRNSLMRRMREWGWKDK